MKHGKDASELRHALVNRTQEKLALQGLLKKAANELENLSDADCTPEARESAEQTAKRLRRAADL